MRKMIGLPVLLLMGAAAGCAPMVMTPIGGVQMAPAALRAVELREDMRRLWTDHVVWTRDYMIAALADHPGAQASLTRLLRNQQDIGNAITPFYGGEAGRRLTELLTEHIEIAGELVVAAQAGDQATLGAANQRWQRNAAEIATFLSEANPHWSRSDLQHMLTEHLTWTTHELMARLHGNWEEDVTIFDRVLNQAIEMADALTDGLIRQFPAVALGG